MTTIEKLVIAFIAIILLAGVGQIFICFPYYMKPITEAPLLCTGSSRIIVNSR